MTKQMVLSDGDSVKPAASTLQTVVNFETSVSGQVIVDLFVGSETEPRLTSLPLLGNDVNASVVWNATLINEPQFSCNNENDPSQMPALSDIHLVTDISNIVNEAGASGFRLRITLQDARLYSITFR